MTKEYILKREKNGIWYSYPTGNWYGMNIDEVLEKVEDDLNNLRADCEYWKSVALHEQELTNINHTCSYYKPKKEAERDYTSQELYDNKE